MGQEPILNLVATINLVAAIGTLFLCGRVIWVHILRQQINKKFVNMFYVAAILICLSIVGLSISIFIKARDIKDDDTIDLNGTMQGPIGVCFGIHSIFYIGLILLQICTMIQITIGLKRSYAQKNCMEADRKARKDLCILYTLCIATWLLTILIEILTLTENEENPVLTVLGVQIFYVCLAVGLFVIYSYSLCRLFAYMNTEENPALQPEHNKMAWQSGFFLVSLLIFLTIKLLVLFGAITSISMFTLVYQVIICCMDMAPILYVVYCHNKSFERMAANNIYAQ